MARDIKIIIDDKPYHLFVYLNGDTSVIPTEIVEKRSKYYKGIGYIFIIGNHIFKSNNCIWNEFDIKDIYQEFEIQGRVHEYEEEELNTNKI